MRRNLLALAVAALATQAHAGTVTTDGADIVIKTKGGFSAKTTDGEYSFKIGGRVQVDYNNFDGVTNSVSDDAGSDLFFRRARIEMKGHAGDWKYGLSYNFAVHGGDSSIDQFKVTYTGFGKMANLTVGQQKENFGLEDTGSSKWITAIERSLVANAFDTGNNIGIKLHGASDMLTYSIGAFEEGNDADNDLESAFTGRVVVRPVFTKDAVVHLGGGFTQRKSDAGFDDFGSRLVRGGADKEGTKYSPQFTSGDSDEMSVYNLEAAFAKGPVHLMAEYYDGELDAPESVANSDDLEADGYYLQAGYVLTGESRSYKKSGGAFGAVKPKGKNGAWEIFARYDSMSADSGNNITLEGGDDAEVFTVGVNWYANSNVKVALNYVTAETDQAIGGDDDGDALVGRLQFAF